MSKRAFALIAVLGLLLTVSVAFEAAAAPKERVTTPTSKEAWYAQAPPCAALDCSVVPLVTPYPEDTLHVAVSGGQETARTYLAWPLVLPQGSRLTGGELTLPVDTDASHGSATPETAAIVACLATPNFKPVRGSLEEPPEANCKLRRSALYDEKKAVFTVDLDSFAKKWTSKKAALALLPSKSAQETFQSWHVVFPASPKDDEQQTENSAAIEARLTYSLFAQDGSTGPVVGADTAPPALNEPAPTFDTGTAPTFDSAAGGFTQPVDLGQASTPTEITPQQVTPTTSFIEGFAGPGFAYPMVWALPLILLAGFAAIGRALTKELYRRDL